jgi:hypothetical protein
VGLIARMTINEEKDADGNVFYQDPFEAVGVLGELIATARQIVRGRGAKCLDST